MFHSRTAFKIREFQVHFALNFSKIQSLAMHERTDYFDGSRQIRNRALKIIEPVNTYLSAKLATTIEIREHFALDGAVLYKRKDFSQLPPFLNRFFTNDRASCPSALFAYQTSYDDDPSGITVKDMSHYVVLRGSRYYDYDGKYNFGPNEEPAVYLLLNNLAEDAQVAPQLLGGTLPENVPAWLQRIASWDYIRNDLATLYYLKRCQGVLQPQVTDNLILTLIERSVYQANGAYFDALLLRQPHFPADIFSNVVKAAARSREQLVDFIHTHHDLDLIRSHRELASPQALLFAAHLAFNTQLFDRTDIIVAPLFGGLDIAAALQYVGQHGDSIFKDVTGTDVVKTATVFPKIINILPKISLRATFRRPGQTDHLHNQLDTLDQESAITKQYISNAHKVALVDDSAGTLGTVRNIKNWISGLNPTAEVEVKIATAHSGIRWARQQNTAIAEHLQTESIALAPVTHNLTRRVYHWGSLYLPDKVITQRALYTDRIIYSNSEIVAIIDQLQRHQIVRGVGFDLYETLVRRTIGNRERRNLLNQHAVAVLQTYGFTITAEDYYQHTAPIWAQAKRTKEASQKEVPYQETLKSMVINICTRKQWPLSNELLTQLVEELYTAEIQLEMETTIVEPETPKILEYIQAQQLPLGIYSNTPYKPSDMLSIMQQTGLSAYFPSQQVLFSSETGLMKPHRETMYLLARNLGIEPKNLVFVGNSFVDIAAAASARAIPVLRFFKNEHSSMQKHIDRWRLFSNEQTRNQASNN
jgi:phosphoglycolate phosphatase-like HAD superfamily hydrolase